MTSVPNRGLHMLMCSCTHTSTSPEEGLVNSWFNWFLFRCIRAFKSKSKWSKCDYIKQSDSFVWYRTCQIWTWRLCWFIMNFNIKQSVQNYYLKWSRKSFILAFSLVVNRIVCEFDKKAPLLTHTARVRRKTLVFRSVTFRCTLNHEAKREKLMRCRNKSAKGEKEDLKKNGPWSHYTPCCETSGSSTLVLSAFFTAAGVPTESCVITQVHDEKCEKEDKGAEAYWSGIRYFWDFNFALRVHEHQNNIRNDYTGKTDTSFKDITIWFFYNDNNDGDDDGDGQPCLCPTHHSKIFRQFSMRLKCADYEGHNT